MRDALNDFGVLIDTLEVSVTWDHVEDLYRGSETPCKADTGVVEKNHRTPRVLNPPPR